MSDSVRPHRRQPTRLPHPWDSPGKNTGVGCHFLLQCMKMKSESEVTQLCLTLSDPMDCSLPGSSIHGIFQARVLEWVAIAFSTNLRGKPKWEVSIGFRKKRKKWLVTLIWAVGVKVRRQKPDYSGLACEYLFKSCEVLNYEQWGKGKVVAGGTKLRTGFFK